MAQLYFSKFNINAQIYDVYAKPELEQIILNEVFERIDSNQVYIGTYKNDDGEEMEYRYKFCDIIKDYDNRNIVGRLVKIYDGEAQSYDAEEDTVSTVWEEDRAASSTFCFDLVTEEIAFITRQGLKYRQFNKYFKLLVEKYFPEDTFEIYLENNIGELKKKISRMKRILSIESIIVPPNANESEYDILFGATKEEVRESGATVYKQALETQVKGGKSLKLNTGIIGRMFYAVSKGYGELVAKGRDHSNTNMTVTSYEDAPYTLPIPEKEKDALIAFRERALPAITQLVLDKQQRTLEMAGDFDEENDGDQS